MKATKYTQILALTAATVVATTFLSGCASTGFKQGNLTAKNIQSTSDRLTKLTGQLDATLTSLNDLTTKPQSDLRPQYKQFAGNVAHVEASAKAIAKARNEMADKQKAYFAKWDEEIAQIQNADLKAISQSRKETVAKNLLAIKTSYAEVDMTFKPFLADLSDVQKYLSVDLTTAGLAAIKEPVAKATKDVAPLKISLAKLARDFSVLSASLSSVTPAAK